MKPEKKSIKELYSKADVFITGSTGFVGKVLVEKLLRSCPDIKTIYLLLRPKQGQEPANRIREMTENLLFSKFVNRESNLLNKLQVIEGDVKSLGLGISDSDREKLKSCSIIFHLAASVRFDDHLKDAILLNLRGTREVCELAKSLTNLKAFVHVSTAYVQPKNIHIEEKFFPSDCDWKTYIRFAENLDANTLDSLTQKLTKFAPNTYTMTKHLAEQCCNDYKLQQNLPIIIYRPSIVSYADSEFTGWCDTLNGPNGLFISYFSGIKRVYVSKLGENYSMDMIPVDICVKGMLIAAAKDQKMEKEIPVYNAASVTSISMLELKEISKPLVEYHLLENSIGVPTLIFTKCVFFGALVIFFLQIIPALLIDAILKILNKKPLMMKYQRILRNTDTALHFFMNNNFTFDTEKFLELGRNLKENDKKDFCIQPKIDKFEYFRQSYIVSKEIILKETENSEKIALKRAFYWKTAALVMRGILCFLLYKFAIYSMKCIKL